MSLTDIFRGDAPWRGVFQPAQKEHESAPVCPDLQLASRAVLPLSLDARLRARLSSPYLQIASPYCIETALLQPFLDHRQKIIIVPQEAKSIVASLHSIHQAHLVAALDPGETLLKRLIDQGSEIVLVVFPVLPEQSYALQTRVAAISGDQAHLQYQVPRHDLRWRVRAAAPVSLHLPPPTVMAALGRKQLHFTREMRWQKGTTRAVRAGALTDRLANEPHSSRFCPELLRESVALSCSLRDISRGGVNLLLAGDQRAEDLAHRLVLLHVPLSLATLASAEGEEERIALTLQLLGTVRAVRTLPSSRGLHIQFLERLAEEFDTFFARMEGETFPTLDSYVL